MDQTTQTKELRLTWSELATTLMRDSKIELSEGQSLIIHQIDTNDFMSAVEELEPGRRLAVFVEIMRRFALEVGFEGSLTLGAFNLADHSWTLTSGNSRFVRITAQPITLRKPIIEIVSFLSKLPLGQALALKPFQKLFIEDLSADRLLDYYQSCQGDNNLAAQEQKQDELFMASCPMLTEKNLSLRIYGLGAA